VVVVGYSIGKLVMLIFRSVFTALSLDFPASLVNKTMLGIGFISGAKIRILGI
jgi:hypothetical protein